MDWSYCLLNVQIYRILGHTVICYPIILDEKDFYMSLDMSLLIDEFQVCYPMGYFYTTSNTSQYYSPQLLKCRQNLDHEILNLVYRESYLLFATIGTWEDDLQFVFSFEKIKLGMWSRGPTLVTWYSLVTTQMH